MWEHYITTSNVLQVEQIIYNAVKSNLDSMQNLGFDPQPRPKCSAWSSASLTRSSSKLTWKVEVKIAAIDKTQQNRLMLGTT